MPEMDKTRIYGMLREVKEVAMQASLTHSMRGCTPVLADMYNQCLKALMVENNDPLLQTLFHELPRDTVTLDEVGASAALLSRYVKPSHHSHGYETDHDSEDEDDDR
jgi:hypothetical protein